MVERQRYGDGRPYRGECRDGRHRDAGMAEIRGNARMEVAGVGAGMENTVAANNSNRYSG